MSVYLTIFSKLRYLGLVEINDNENEIKNGENTEKCVNCENSEKCVNNDNRLALLNTMRGPELGILHGVLSPEQQERYRIFCLEDNAEQLKGPEPMLQNVEFVRFATPEDIEENYKCRNDEERALVRAREILVEHNLLMKLVDVEYVLDRKKLFFYFTSDQRVDFRAYVRDLAREFRTRIEMRQIGVRDESRAVKGIASCGRPCCCSYWLHHFTPICMKMVKEQKLALNPTKISGICGRLMCCLAYEQPNYEALWDKLPPPGTKIKSGDDFYIVESVELGTESVNIRFPTGSIVPIAIKDFENFNAIINSGGEWGVENEQVSEVTVRGRRHEGLRPHFISSYGGLNNLSLDLNLKHERVKNVKNDDENVKISNKEIVNKIEKVEKTSKDNKDIKRDNKKGVKCGGKAVAELNDGDKSLILKGENASAARGGKKFNKYKKVKNKRK